MSLEMANSMWEIRILVCHQTQGIQCERTKFSHVSEHNEINVITLIFVVFFETLESV